MKKPVIAIPIGDPAGVGPEIVAKSIASDEVFGVCHRRRSEDRRKSNRDHRREFEDQ